MARVDIRTFMQMSKEEQHKEALNSLWDTTEKCAIEIARARRTAKLLYDIENEEFDERLNEMCVKAHDKFCDMNKDQMKEDMIREMMMGLLDL